MGKDDNTYNCDTRLALNLAEYLDQVGKQVDKIRNKTQNKGNYLEETKIRTKHKRNCDEKRVNLK